MRSEHLIDRNGKTFCLYAGLLDTAHAQGLKEIRTELLQVPTQENGQTAIVQATVTTEKGVFQGIGDANPQNVARAMVNCLIRLAETRAKARALRDAVNVGAACLDELDTAGGPDEAQPVSNAPTAPTAAPVAAVRPAPVASGRTGTVPHITPERLQAADAMTPAQQRMIDMLARNIGQEVNYAGMSRREASQVITSMKQRAAAG